MSIQKSRSVVIGSGPLGRAVVESVLRRGHAVRLVSRHPRLPQRDGLEQVAADATDVPSLTAALSGAATVYHCANAPYHRWGEELPAIWQGILSATRAARARLVIGTNLYAYGRPASARRGSGRAAEAAPASSGEPVAAGDLPVLTPDLAFNPCARKGEVRARLEADALAAHERGDLPVTLIRASDFYGPGVRESVLGDRFLGAIANGKPASTYGVWDAPHSYAYLPDFAETMVAIGCGDSGSGRDGSARSAAGESDSPAADSSVWGRSWIVPHDRPVTTRELERLVRNLVPDAKVKLMGRAMLQFGGLFVPAAREMVEMLYEFEEPFVADGSETSHRFGVESTPLEQGLASTLEWYRSAASA